MDRIFLRGLEIRAVIGVTEEERRDRQTIVVDLDLACDVAKAARRDDIADALNYRTIAKAVLRYVEASEHRLLETLAERLAELLQRDHDVAWLRLRVSKPGAVRFSRTVGIEIERGRRQ